jgi:hypothetical protein
VSPQAFRLLTTVVMLAISLCADAAPKKRIHLLSVSFTLPCKLDVEGTGTEEIAAMSPNPCANGYCPPVVFAWECRAQSEPKCSDLNRKPPQDLCAAANPEQIVHSPTLSETRWDCGKVEDSDGTSQVGFSVFDLKDRQLVVSYLGRMSDAAPADFFDFVAHSIRSQ